MLTKDHGVNNTYLILSSYTLQLKLLLSEGSSPAHYKFAFVCTLLQNHTFNKDRMDIYRPVSNLSFLFKVLEKAVMNELNSHINSLNTPNQYQSAYRKFNCRCSCVSCISLNDIIDNKQNVPNYTENLKLDKFLFQAL